MTCYDWDSDGSHDLIGSFDTNLAELEVSARRKGCVAELVQSKEDFILDSQHVSRSNGKG